MELKDKINVQDDSLVIYKIAVDQEPQKDKEEAETKPKITWDLA